MTLRSSRKRQATSSSSAGIPEEQLQINANFELSKVVVRDFLDVFLVRSMELKKKYAFHRTLRIFLPVIALMEVEEQLGLQIEIVKD